MQRPHSRLFWATTTGLLLLTGACTLILDRDKTQCGANADCAHFAAGAICVDSVCQAGGQVADANTSDQNAADVNQPGNTDSGSDAGVDANFSNPGCFAGTPTTSDEFANACTHAQCVAFDNCARLGVCDDAGLAPNPRPDTAPGAPAGPNSTATVQCQDLAATVNNGSPRNIVYVTGSSNFPPFLSTFAPVLAKSNYNVVWQVSNSCAGVDSAFNDNGTSQAFPTAKQQLHEAAGKTTILFDDTGKQNPCLLPSDPGSYPTVDIGESDIFAASCTKTNGYDATTVSKTVVGEYLGPILPMVFVVPKASTEESLSALAGYSVFARGLIPDASAPLPYTDTNQLFIRASSTATNQILSKAINVDPAHWYGVDKGTATNMSSQMSSVVPALAQETIGIISADFVNANPDLKTLAFQAQGQSCGFYPDSTLNALDKANVRDGHYQVWGPIHFFTKLNGGVPSTPGAQAFVKGFAETSLEQDLLLSIIKSHVVPSCAMKVTRDTEMGPIHGYSPPTPCGCFFDANSAGGTAVTPAGCTPCASSADCKDPSLPACNYGFCEAH